MRFGDFELDLKSGELRRNGERVKLQEQPFRLLAYLMERAGEVVTRDELRERLWPSEFVDFDHSLNTAVRKLRTSLDDSADEPRYIETLARRGYRFIAPMEQRLRAVARPAKTRVPWVVIAIAVAVVALAAIFVTRAMRPRPVDTVAVLPFQNVDRQNEYLTDGLTDVLIDTLSQIPNLKVMARTTVFQYKGRTIDPVRIAKELGVAAIVTGSVHRDNNQNRIHVELIDRDGSQIWGDTYLATAAELPSMQTRIAEDLSLQMRRGFGDERRQLLARRYTRSGDAYDAYLWGLHEWNRRANLDKAIEYFSQAIKLDPNFAAAYAGLANTYGVMVGYNLISPEDGIIKISANAQRALDLDPGNAEALVSLATLKFRSLWDFAGAERDYKRALQLNPNYATGHQWYSDYLRSMGRFDEAARQIDLAVRLDPQSSAIHGTLCWSFYLQRRFDDMNACASRFGYRSELHVKAMVARGDVAGAVNELAKLKNPFAAELVAAYGKGKEQAFFRKRLEQLQRDGDKYARNPLDFAAVYAQLGDRDNAFAWLEQAYRHRLSGLTNFHIDPAFDKLRTDPRFDDLRQRIGLPTVDVPGL